MLRDVVGFHCTLNRHSLWVNGVDDHADRPGVVMSLFIVCRYGLIGESRSVGVEGDDSGRAWWMVEACCCGVRAMVVWIDLLHPRTGVLALMGMS